MAAFSQPHNASDLKSPHPLPAHVAAHYPFTGSIMNLQGLRYHYLDEGQGAPVVMLHCNASWSIMYRHVVHALSPNYRCIVPDHIGCGLSDKPSDTEYNYRLDQRVADLDALLTH